MDGRRGPCSVFDLTHQHIHIYIHMHSIHGKLPTLSAELMERLRQALLLFMPRVNMKGPVPFLAKPVPTRCASSDVI